MELQLLVYGVNVLLCVQNAFAYGKYFFLIKTFTDKIIGAQEKCFLYTSSKYFSLLSFGMAIFFTWYPEKFQCPCVSIYCSETMSLKETLLLFL